jgi:Na+/H+ antiporter NhaD/arsenite permease-like protein
MARRKGRTDNRSYQTSNAPRGKSAGEERAERLTWFFLVAIFALLQITETAVPNWAVPVAGAVVLLGSGLYQYSRGWKVSPVTWLAGALLVGLAYINFEINPDRNFIGLALLVFAGVILFGLLTGET